MIVTRKGVFETNSSSTHSIVIQAGDYIPSHLPIQDGVVSIHAGKFGWEVEDFHDAATKASYCLTYAKYVQYQHKLRDGQAEYGGKWDNKTNTSISGPLHKRKDANWLLTRLEEVIKGATGADRVEWVPVHAKGDKPYEWGWHLEEDDWGYIDHQSDGVCYEAFKDDQSLRAFIFNEESVLHTDNDNH